MRWLRRVNTLLDQLRSTYWFLPSSLTAGAVVLALGCIAFDRWAERTTPWMGWTYGGGADGARALLSAIAGSMITVVSVTFSVLVVALTVSSQHFGPRLLRSFMRDQPAQLVLGAFTGTFAYCLIVLRSVQGDGGDRFPSFVPHLAVSGSVIAALIAVGLLIYYVHHVAVSMQVTAITERIAGDLERAIDRLFPEPLGESPDPPAAEPMPPPDDATPIPAPASGYVQEIDTERLLGGTVTQNATIWLRARPGDFVVRGESIGSLCTHGDAGAMAERVSGALVIGPERTGQQDAAFGIQQLVEVTLRALSPGTNEPFTAIAAIDRIGQVLSMVAGRRIPSATRVADSGRLRVVALPRTFAQLAEDAFAPIADYGGGHASVLSHVFVTMERVLRHTHRASDAATLRRLADRIWATAERTVEDHERRRLLTLQYGRLAGAYETRLRDAHGRSLTATTHQGPAERSRGR